MTGFICAIPAGQSLSTGGGMPSVLAHQALGTVAEGVITRAVPQINIMSISFAIKIGVSVAVVFAGMPAVVAAIGSILMTMQALTAPVLGAMR